MLELSGRKFFFVSPVALDVLRQVRAGPELFVYAWKHYLFSIVLATYKDLENTLRL